MWKVRAHVAGAVLNHVTSLPPKEKAAWTQDDAHTLATQIRAQVEAEINRESQQLEIQIESGAEFLTALQIYSSKQFWGN